MSQNQSFLSWVMGHTVTKQLCLLTTQAASWEQWDALC